MINYVGKWLIAAGFLLMVAGVIIYFWGGKFGWIGHLPGDIRIEGEHFRFYFPITTMILASIILSLLFTFLSRFLNRFF